MLPDDDVWLSALRREAAHLRPRGRYYLPDLVISAGLGWGLAGLAATTSSPLVAVLAVLGAGLAVLRAGTFLHEIAHFGPRAPRGFVPLWRLLVGLPMAIPTLMVGSHVHHHHPSSYGTVLDPEYEPVAHWARWQLVTSVLAMVLVPPLLAARWAVLAPLSWLVPPLRRLVVARASSLVTNAAYVRPAPTGRARRAFVREELAAWAWWSAATAGLVLGALPWRLAVVWWAVATVALMINQIRTNVAHVYVVADAPRRRAAQGDDTLTLAGGVGTMLLAPVGNAYHAAHHLFPAVPYHAMRALHHRLCAALPVDAAYRRLTFDGIVPALVWAWRRAAATTRRQGHDVAGPRSGTSASTGTGPGRGTVRAA